jgi:hypothetical protein
LRVASDPAGNGISTTDQALSIQQTALKAAGCKVIRAEKRSGTTTAGREELKTVLDFPRDRRRDDGHPYRSARPEYRRPQDNFGDFVNFDCILIDRKAFLAQIGRGFSVKKIREHDVIIRILGYFATIHARTSYEKANGTQGAGRYTNDWRFCDGRWLCVSAPVTRL